VTDTSSESLSEGLDRVVERLGGLAEAVTTRLAAPSEAPAVAPPAPAPPSADLSPEQGEDLPSNYLKTTAYAREMSFRPCRAR